VNRPSNSELRKIRRAGSNAYESTMVAAQPGQAPAADIPESEAMEMDTREEGVREESSRRANGAAAPKPTLSLAAKSGPQRLRARHQL
jgi:hypothetical protein